MIRFDKRKIIRRVGEKRNISMAVLSVFVLLSGVFCMPGILPGTVGEVSAEGTYVEESEAWVADTAALLSEDEVSALDDTGYRIYETYGVMPFIVTVDAYGSTDIKDWERELFAQWGYLEEDNCIMLAIAMTEREWGIVTFGYAQEAFTTYGRETIGEMITPYLSDGDYNGAMTEYLRLVDNFLVEAQNNEPFSEENPYVEEGAGAVLVLMFFAGGLILSFIISLIVVMCWKRSMNTRVHQDGAGEYLLQNSVDIGIREDIFLYRTLTKTARPKDDDSGGSIRSDRSGSSGKF